MNNKETVTLTKTEWKRIKKLANDLDGDVGYLWGLKLMPEGKENIYSIMDKTSTKLVNKIYEIDRRHRKH